MKRKSFSMTFILFLFMWSALPLWSIAAQQEESVPQAATSDPGSNNTESETTAPDATSPPENLISETAEPSGTEPAANAPDPAVTPSNTGNPAEKGDATPASNEAGSDSATVSAGNEETAPQETTNEPAPEGETDTEPEGTEDYISANPDAPDARVMIPEEPSPIDSSEASKDPTQPGLNNPENSPNASEEEKVDPDRVLTAGYPESKLAVREMYEDMIAGMNTRRVTSIYDQWKRYCASVLGRTARATQGELNGRCRLSWYDRLYREPIASVMEVESFSKSLYCNFAGNATDVRNGIQKARVKMDVRSSSMVDAPIAIPQSPEEAVEFLQEALISATKLHAKSVEPLKPAELQVLTKESLPIFCTQVYKGHTLPSVGRAKYLIDLMNRMNRAAIYDAVETLIPILDTRFLEQLAAIQPNMFDTFDYKGKQIQRITTSAGDILIGGPEDNVWELDKLSNIICVIDLGGNDKYLEGSCNISRPVLVVLDLGTGNDEYIGSNPGIQGSSILGISLWYNQGGENTYRAKYIAQGSTIGGAGILIDNAGNDKYNAFVRGQGCALCGLGLLIDRDGQDDYHAALFAQGLGHPGGFGALVDKTGNDHYYVGGYYQDSYEEHPGYDGWGQGLGTGIRQVACGGIGVMLDGAGDDVYEFDYFAHGGGYWMGLGFARDFGGNDKRLGATLLAYDGNPRREARWQRFSNGFGCHYALGYLFDDDGNDSYNGTIMGLGMAWDLSAGFLVDFLGDDAYESTGGLTQGTGAEGSIGVLMDYRGNDIYRGRNQGYDNGRLTYHMQSNCGGNFSFVVDHGNKDQYGSQARNNTMTQRGTATGFIIDRPTEGELEADRIAAQKAEEEQANNPEAAQRPAASGNQENPQYQNQPSRPGNRMMSPYQQPTSRNPQILRRMIGGGW